MARARACGLALALVGLAFATRAHATPPAPFAARAGLDRATVAASVWATDAQLVYLENDEALGDDGTSARWGYLFYSPSLQRARAYSLRGGKIVVAENLEMKFEAPPVPTGWIDSDAALRAADASLGRDYRRDHAARASTMLLTRGTFQDGDPDPATWTVVYTSPNAPSLFVVIDAATGKVSRSWRG
ncbi:MAG TPA: hypothetical protein VMH61_07025 [Candidatus Acidoferrales bacterium]|nr:hypothetical protein [Candidatus Acidoferrales bacterium]